MDRLVRVRFTRCMTKTTQDQLRATTLKAITKRSFCTLATTSDTNRPHVAGVIYADVDTVLYVNTARGSRKARNITANPHAAVCILVRRIPFGPPATIQFQARAELLAMDDPEIVPLIEGGRLKAITSHGELDEPDNCFVRITPTGRINTYGLGMSLWQLYRHPLDATGVVELAHR